MKPEYTFFEDVTDTLIGSRPKPPSHIECIISRHFQRCLKANPKKAYVFFGNPAYHYELFPGEAGKISGSGIMKLANPDHRKVALMDIGAGNATFLEHYAKENSGSVCVSISAHDMRGSLKTMENHTYITGKNVENLIKVIHNESAVPKQYDFIFSKHTLMHVKDPLGLIQQAYKLLTPGGVLFVDSFNLNIDHTELSDPGLFIAQHLKKIGHCVILNHHHNKIISFAIRKIDEEKPLIFPVAYDEKKSKYIYTIPLSLLKDYKFSNDAKKIEENAIKNLTETLSGNNKLETRLKNISIKEAILFCLHDELMTEYFPDKNGSDLHHIFFQIISYAVYKNNKDSYTEMSAIYNQLTTPFNVAELVFSNLIYHEKFIVSCLGRATDTDIYYFAIFLIDLYLYQTKLIKENLDDLDKFFQKNTVKKQPGDTCEQEKYSHGYFQFPRVQGGGMN